MTATINFQIKCRWDNAVRFECEVDASLSYGEQLGFAVKAALKVGANLADAYLARANLAGANLADANLAGANLADAYLARANLAGANLADANLADANLVDANLADANLARANLADAYLARANLAGANLADANLAGANLAGAYLADAKWRNGIVITKAPVQIYGLTWPVTILDTHMQIGCELHSHAEWRAFDDRHIAAMDGLNAARFWRLHKEILLRLCDAHAGNDKSEVAA
jgi:hypothetical protein